MPSWQLSPFSNYSIAIKLGQHPFGKRTHGGEEEKEMASTALDGTRKEESQSARASISFSNEDELLFAESIETIADYAIHCFGCYIALHQ